MKKGITLIGIALLFAFLYQWKDIRAPEIAASNCSVYDLGGETPSQPVIQAFNNRLIIATRGNAAAGYQTFVNEWNPATKKSIIPDISGKAGGGWLWVQGGATSDTPQLKIEGTKLAMYVKGWAGGPLDAAFRTEYTGIYPDYWIPWVYTGQGASMVIPGTFSAALGGKTYNVKKDTDNSVLLEECMSSGGANTVTVSKTFSGVTSFTPTLLLDGKAPDATSVSSATWNNVSQGAHRITTSLVPGAKAFYAACVNSAECYGPLRDGSSISFTHTASQNDALRFVYTTSDAYLTIAVSRQTTPLSAHEIDDAMNLIIADTCSLTFKANVVEGERSYQWLKEAAAAWAPTGVTIAVEAGGQAYGNPISCAEIRAGVGNDTINTLRLITTDLIDCDGSSPLGWEVNYGAVASNQGERLLKLYSDIAFTQDNRKDYFMNVAVHEMGHALGLDHDVLGSVMYYEADSIITKPSQEDIAQVKALYPSCAPPNAPPAILSLQFSPNPPVFGNASTAGFGKLCEDSDGLDGPNWWRTVATVREIGGKIGITLTNVEIEYIHSGGLTSVGFPFSRLTAEGIPGSPSKGFPSSKINAGSSMDAVLCQVPWIPEQLNSIFMKVRGTDDKGNSVEAANTMHF